MLADKYGTGEDANGNTVLDTEDTNGNGVLDPGEDTNGNTVLDTEDTNGNGLLDPPTTIEGNVSGAQIYSGTSGIGATGPVITVNFALSSGFTVAHPAELNGRLLTLVDNGKPSVSHRIVRATGSGTSFTLAITNPRSPHQWTGGTTSSITNFSGSAIINGRDFAGFSGDANEAWDGFDVENPFLAFLEPDSSSVSRTNVRHPSYYPGLASLSALDTIDNDGDGVDDGVFLDWGLPSFPTASGTIDLHASALIVDLGGRFNANVHGSLASMPIRQSSGTVEMYSSSSKWPGATGTQPPDRASINTELSNVPLGSGIGVAEVNPNHVFSSLAMNASAALDQNNEPVLGDEPQMNEQVGALFTAGGRALSGERPTTGRFRASLTPRIGNIEGRYGGAAANLDAIQSQMNTPSFNFANSSDNNMMANPGANAHVRQEADSILQEYGIPSSNWFTGSHGAYGSPPDVFGRMKFLTRRPIQEFEDINDNGVLDNEDTNGDGVLDPGEDTNGNGVLDNEDADGNGALTSANDLDGTGADDTYGLVPRPTFAKAEWSNERAASPYSSRLISMGSRGGLNHAPSTDGTSSVATRSTNPFTLAELETILRPYDIDSQQLPMRLTAMLGTVAEYMRTAITTESWDTTGIVDGSVLYEEDTNSNGVLEASEDFDGNSVRNYYYEDANGNGVLDTGEDTNGNGNLDLWGAWGLIKHNMALLPTSAATLYNNNDPLRGSVGGEVSRGEKFDLNRPLSLTQPSTYNANHPYYLQRQGYFKDLYTLLILLSNLSEDINGNGVLDSGEDLDGNTVLNFFDEVDTNGNGILEPTEDLNGDGVRQSKKILAQWAANVVEFRDADSTMTPFEYDTDLIDGWQCDGDVTTLEADRGETIWGTERPEILITSGVGWEQSTTGGSSSDFGEIYIGLHRPWNSDALNGPSGARINAMLPDEDFDTAASENIDISKMSQDGTNAIWRFRLEDTVSGASTTVPITLPVVADLDLAYPPAGTKSPWAKAALLGADDWLGVRLAELPQPGILPFAPRLGRDHDNPSTDATRDSELEIFNVSLPGAPVTPGEDRIITVHLERLDCLNRNTTDPLMAPTDGYSGSTVSDLIAARYLAVDSMEITVVNRDPFPTGTTVVPTPTDVARVENKRLVGSPSNQEFWRKVSPPNGTGSPATYRTSPSSPGLLASPPLDLGVVTAPTQAHSNIAAFPWPNRPFNSIVELFLIPHDSPSQLLENYRTLLTGPVVHDVPYTLLLDAVRIPTFFAGVNDSWSDPSNNLRGETGIDVRINPVNQMSSYREPGRVNLNTVTNDQIWDAVVAGPLPVEDVNRNGTIDAGEVDHNGDSSPDRNPIVERQTGSGFTGADLGSNPVRVGANILSMGATGSPVRFDDNATFLNSIDVARNPQHRLYTAGRLANTATVRSNLFAVWVTLRESISGDADSVKYHRAFYIIDRSIPVGFQAGEDHNVKDTIRLRRIIE